ncbi:MAG: endonuclease [Candidatus Thorarchaeota archaeon]|nr:endonuclease [Candidatus Thorarchaeota archaeon]
MAFEELALGLSIGLLIALFVYFAMNWRVKHRISMVEAEFRRMWAEQEGDIRKDAAQRSRYVLKGKIAEHMVPMFPDMFKFNPADARFIGSPIDYLIFDGYTSAKDEQSEAPITVVLADIKTGDARLNRTERMIKEAVETGRVRWETIRVEL